jgi:hypothetical protein
MQPGVPPSESEILFREHLAYSPWEYSVVADADDYAALDEWKREADSVLARMEEELPEMVVASPGQRTELQRAMHKAFGDGEPSVEDKILFAIGRVLVGRQKVESSGQKATASGALKFFRGGEHRLRELGTVEGGDTCVDVPAAALALAREFGMEGEVTHDAANRWHYFFRAPDGRVVDTIFGANQAGLFENPEAHAKASKAFLEAQRHATWKKLRGLLGGA